MQKPTDEYRRRAEDDQRRRDHDRRDGERGRDPQRLTVVHQLSPETMAFLATLFGGADDDFLTRLKMITGQLKRSTDKLSSATVDATKKT
jgi:hypothetical protein